MSKSRVSNALTVEQILAGHTPDVQVLAVQLRDLFHERVPQAREKVYPGWHAIGYTHPGSGYFGAIFPQTDHVRIGLEYGALLPDPDGLLEGNGSQLRYMTVRCLDEQMGMALRRFIRAALELPASRQSKLDLLRGV